MKRAVQSGTLRFIFIAIVFMLLMDQFVFGGKRSYIEDAKTVKIVEKQEEALASAPKTPPVRVTPEEGEYFEQIPAETPNETIAEEKPPQPVVVEEQKPEVVPPKLNGAKIAIIIDDLGMDVKHTKQVLDLPAPITLAFLPYAPRTRELAASGKAKGHELIIHTPMEAMDGKLNIGPGGLKSSMSAAELDAAFKVMLESFDGYVGINNHMGSRLTQDKAKMDELMGILAKRGLFFVDSKTIQTSVAADEAAKAGVKYAERDVFLDHVETRAFVDKALAQAERTAARKGYAIAIGHPKSFTIEGLQAWIPTLAAKGIEIVPVSDLLVTPKVVVIGVDTKKEEVVPIVVVPVTPDPVVPDPVVPEPIVAEPTPTALTTQLPAPSVDMFPESAPAPENQDMNVNEIY
jgi:uncharacterized protein